MLPTPIAIYVAGYLQRSRAMHRAGSVVVETPAAAGLAPTNAGGHLRLAVVHDDALATTSAVVDIASSGTVTVFDTAPRCAGLLATRSGWRPEPATAMAHRDLRSAPAAELPDELHLRPIRRIATDDPHGVALTDAVALVTADDGDDTPGHVGLAAYLAALPASTRLLAAVDRDGTVLATSGYSVVGEHAHVLLVNTAAASRGRGVGTAMTGAAVAAARAAGARAAGARYAHLDASAAGLGLYLRMGFEVAGPTTRFTARRPETA